MTATKIISLSCFMGMAMYAQSASADNITCPVRITPENPINRKDYRGRDLAKEYYFNAAGTWLKVPLGHLNPWYGAPLEDITPLMPDAAEKRKGTGLDFVFWMPTLRWPERDKLSVPFYRFCEDGRRMPEDGEYIVVASITHPWQPISASPLRDRLPAERLENTKKYLAFTPSGSEYGLDHYEGPEGAVDDYFFSGGDRSLVLQCYKREKYLNPLCVGHVWWSLENLGMYIRFSLQDLPRWRENIDAAYKLAHSWRENAKQPETR